MINNYFLYFYLFIILRIKTFLFLRSNHLLLYIKNLKFLLNLTNYFVLKLIEYYNIIT